MQIAIPLYDRFTALDAIGPYEVLSRLPGARVEFVAAEPGVVRTDTRMLPILVEQALEAVPAPDVVVVPGACSTGCAARTRAPASRPRCAAAR
jgi:putative intracellular protease/amidase